MTFPQTIRESIVEIYIDGAWTDITSDVQQRDLSAKIMITRGKQAPDGQTIPASCDLMLNNRLGKYSPRNPMGIYFDKFGRNTPLRVRIGDTPAPSYDASSSPTAGTGDLSWTHTPVGIPRGVLIFLIQSGSTSDQVTSVTYGDTEIPLTGSHSGAGETGGLIQRYFLGSGIPRGAQSVLVDVSGAATKQAVCITMTALGDTEIHSGLGGWNNGTGSNPSSLGDPLMVKDTRLFGALHSGRDAIADVAAGTGFTDVMEHDFGSDVGSVIRKTASLPGGSSAPASAVSWTAASDTYLVMDAAVADTGIRFSGEIASLPPRWDVSGRDAYVPVTANGLLRRVNQGDAPATSGLQDYLRQFLPWTYWPLTDGPTATTGVNLEPGGQTFAKKGGMVAQFGKGDFGSEWLQPGLQVNGGTSGWVEGDGTVWAVGSGTPNLAYDFIYRAEVLGDLRVDIYAFDLTTFKTSAWRLDFRTDGTNNDIQLTLIEDVGGLATTTVLGSSAALTAVTDGQIHYVRFSLTDNGTSVNYAVHVDTVSVFSGTRASYDLSGDINFESIEFYYTGTAGVDTALALGHVIGWGGTGVPTVDTVYTAIQAFLGETAGRRFERLCGQEEVPFTYLGDLDETIEMGPQFSDYFANQLTEIETTDRGMLYEPRDSLAIGYRTRASLYNQEPTATIDFSANELAQPFEPVDDDQHIRNDVFAQKREGSSYQATLETGALSVQDPPDGVGRYKDEVQVNVESDAILPEMAGWLLHLGTVDEARYPQLTVDLANPNVAANTTLTDAILTVDIGDRILVTNAINANIYDDISLLVLGYTETINAFEHRITFTCTPESPYQVLELDDADFRIDSGDGSTLNEALDTTETGIDVASSGFLWTTDAGQMPISIMVGGEEMSVTAISGASSPQTDTATRSINNVVKTHSTGAVVRLKRPATLAL